MKKISEVVKAYRSERRRILAQLRNIRKRGFEIDFEIPTVPKKITAGSVNRLKKITTVSLQEKAVGANPRTGEQIDFRSFKNIWRNLSKSEKSNYLDTLRYLNSRAEVNEIIDKQRAQTDRDLQSRKSTEHLKYDPTTQSEESASPPATWELAYDNFMSIVSNYSDRAERIIKDRVSQLVSEFGMREVGLMLVDAYESGAILEPSEAYNIGAVFTMLNTFAKILMMNSDTKREFVSAVDEEEYVEDDLFL